MLTCQIPETKDGKSRKHPKGERRRLGIFLD
jgi:hypothetical protein